MEVAESMHRLRDHQTSSLLGCHCPLADGTPEIGRHGGVTEMQVKCKVTQIFVQIISSYFHISIRQIHHQPFGQTTRCLMVELKVFFLLL
jgi:hypothetical protein